MSVAAAAIRMIRGYQKAKAKMSVACDDPLIDFPTQTEAGLISVVVRNTKSEKIFIPSNQPKNSGRLISPLLEPAADKYSPSAYDLRWQ